MLRPVKLMKPLTRFPRLVRSIRTRPPQIEKMNSPEDTSETDGMSDIGQRLGDGPTKSRFQQNRPVLEQHPELKSKPPAQIERELKSKFNEDGMEYDPFFAQKVIETAKTAEEVSVDAVQGGNKLKQVEIDELLTTVDKIIADCEVKIPWQNATDEEIDREIDTLQHTQITNEEGLVEAAASAFMLSEQLSPNGLDALPGFLRSLSSHRLRKQIPLEKLFQLFQISTQLLDEKARDECIYHSGNLVYTASKARADPINEMFFIESILNHGEPKRALKLYESRKDKPDVENERFWAELGVKILLQLDHVDEADALAKEIQQRFGYIHPVSIALLIQKHLDSEPDAWWQEMRTLMNEYGLVDHIEVPSMEIWDDKEAVYDFYNRVDPVSWDYMTKVAVEMLKAKKIEQAMNVIETTTCRDKEFLPFFVDYLKNNGSYPLREYLFNKLQTDTFDCPPGIVQYITEQLDGRHAKSLEEVLVLQETLGYLQNILDTYKLQSEDKLIVSGLISSLSIGASLTGSECRDIFRLLLRVNSQKSFQLITRILDLMDDTFKTGNRGIFPASDSHVYLEIVQMLGRRKQPRTKEIEYLLDQLRDLGIPITTVLANQVLLSYRKARQYTKAIRFVDDYLEYTTSQPTSRFFRNVLQLYKDSIKDQACDNSTRLKRLVKLRNMFKQMMEAPRWEMDEPLLAEILTTFMTFDDIPSAICALEYYGMNLGVDVSNGIMLLIRLKLQDRVKKMQRHLDDQDCAQISEALSAFENLCGVQSTDKYLHRTKYGWRDAAAILVRYEEVFHYDPTVNGLRSFYSSDQEIANRKRVFEQNLASTQEIYGLTPVRPSEIL